VFSEYLLAQLTFILIYSVVGLGLMLLAGFTGSVLHRPCGLPWGGGLHAGCVLTNMGVPFPIALALAGALSAAVGVVVGCLRCGSRAFTWALPRCRLASSSKKCLHAGNRSPAATPGKTVGQVNIFGWVADTGASFYFVCLVVTVVCTLAVLNLLRSPTGAPLWPSAILKFLRRAWASTWPITRHCLCHLSRTGGYWWRAVRPQIRFSSPDQFNIIQSIDLLLMVVIGGLGSVHGASWGPSS
jgi:branched-chain amino acid transport system permease protein